MGVLINIKGVQYLHNNIGEINTSKIQLTINTIESDNGVKLGATIFPDYIELKELKWSIVSESEHAAIDEQTGELTINWSNDPEDIIVKVEESETGLSATKTIQSNRVWHPTIIEGSDILAFPRVHVQELADRGIVSLKTHGGNRAIWGFKKGICPPSLYSYAIPTFGKNGQPFTPRTELQDQIDAQIYIPKGCKTVSVTNNTPYWIGFSVPDTYGTGDNVVDNGWIHSGNSTNINVSSYSKGITTDRPYFLRANMRKSDDSNFYAQDNMDMSGLTIKFIY